MAASRPYTRQEALGVFSKIGLAIVTGTPLSCAASGTQINEASSVPAAHAQVKKTKQSGLIIVTYPSVSRGISLPDWIIDLFIENIMTVYPKDVRFSVPLLQFALLPAAPYNHTYSSIGGIFKTSSE